MNRAYYIVCITFLVFLAENVKGQDNKHGGVVMHTDPRLGLLLQKNRVIANAVKTPKAPKEVTTINTPGTAKPAKTQPVAFSVIAPPSRRGGTITSGKGFRVQIYNGPDRAKAIDIKTEFMRRNPGVRTYLTYISPSFRVKVGNYRSRSDAEGMYREAKSTYTPCMIVPDIITISTF